MKVAEVIILRRIGQESSWLKFSCSEIACKANAGLERGLARVARQAGKGFGTKWFSFA